jgi:hypothetical protein
VVTGVAGGAEALPQVVVLADRDRAETADRVERCGPDAQLRAVHVAVSPRPAGPADHGRVPRQCRAGRAGGPVEVRDAGDRVVAGVGQVHVTAGPVGVHDGVGVGGQEPDTCGGVSGEDGPCGAHPEAADLPDGAVRGGRHDLGPGLFGPGERGGVVGAPVRHDTDRARDAVGQAGQRVVHRAQAAADAQDFVPGGDDDGDRGDHRRRSTCTTN